VSLYDGKESGSLENSCRVLLGMWKTSKTEMLCRVLKNTKGLAGNTVAMRIRGGTFIIEPEARRLLPWGDLWQFTRRILQCKQVARDSSEYEKLTTPHRPNTT
jgi:hypothetical protein